jgi:HAMP domain-containing protein
MGSERLEKTAGIGRWLERRYARVGVRYLYEFVAAACVWGLVVTALAVGGATVLFKGSAAAFWSTLALLVPAMLVALVAGGAFWLRAAQPLRAWMRGARSEDAAPGAWVIALNTHARLPLTAFAALVPVEIALSLFVADRFHTGLASAPLLLLRGLEATVVGVLTLMLFAGQLVMRPVLREISDYLPADAAIGRSRLGLTEQLIMRLATLCVATALVGGVVVLASNDRLGRFALLVTVGPVVVAILGALVFPSAAISLLGPVNDLIAASRRVADGDLTAQVTVLTSDELGELSYSFNEMVGRLRRHDEQLRASRARIVAAADASRRRVERDLHDGAQQHLVLLGLKLGMAERLINKDCAGATALLAELERTLIAPSPTCAIWRTGSTRPCSRTKDCPERSARLRSARRSQPSSSATARVAIRRSSRPPSTSAAWRRSRTPPSTRATMHARPCCSRSATGSCTSKSPTTGEATIPRPEATAPAGRT